MQPQYSHQCSTASKTVAQLKSSVAKLQTKHAVAVKVTKSVKKSFKKQSKKFKSTKKVATPKKLAKAKAKQQKAKKSLQKTIARRNNLKNVLAATKKMLTHHKDKLEAKKHKPAVA